MVDWREARREARSAKSFVWLSYERVDCVGLITFNVPERMNPWGAGMSSEVSRALSLADSDDEVRAVVITGAGRAFCSGLDLGGGPLGHQAVTEYYAEGGLEEDAESREASPEEVVHPYSINKPVIAAINGAALGIGLSYPMLCDVRIVAEDAKLAFLFTKRGLVPELAAHMLVTRAAGLSNAADLLMSGRMFDGKEAARIGLASMAVPKDQVLSVAMEKARSYADAAPASVAFVKRLFWEVVRRPMSMPEVQQIEEDVFSFVGKLPDFKEGIASFVEKRKPVWKISTSNDLPRDLLDPLGKNVDGATVATSKL